MQAHCVIIRVLLLPMTYQLAFALLTFAFVSSITPGPNNLMLMASGANFGFKRTIPHMMGVSLGFVFMVLLVGIGLVQIFETFPQTFTILKICSSLYLLYLSWKIANSAPLQSTADTSAVGPKPFTFLQASLFQWINPKAWTMAMTSIAAYSIQDSPFISVLFICGAYLLVNFPSIVLWALAGTKIKQFLNNPIKTRIFNGIAALLLTATLYPVWFGH